MRRVPGVVLRATPDQGFAKPHPWLLTAAPPGLMRSRSEGVRGRETRAQRGEEKAIGGIEKLCMTY
jgi:hypothetical protein